LEQRRGVLQGLTVTGGEPTLQPDLSIFLKTVKNLGYSVKLDTNGSQPDVLAGLFQQNLVDYVAMDIKTSLPLYQKACGVDVDTACIGRSIDLLKTSGVDYAFRSTAVKPFIEERTLLDIQKVLNHPQRYILQEFILRDQLVAASLLDEKQYTPEEFKALKTKWDMAPGLTFSGRGNNSE